MRKFRTPHFISSTDLKLAKGKYTCSNRRIGAGHIMARLDIFLVQSSLLEEDIPPTPLS